MYLFPSRFVAYWLTQRLARRKDHHMRKSRRRRAERLLVELESFRAKREAAPPDLTPVFGWLIERIAEEVVDRIARDLLSLPVHRSSSERRRRE